MICKHTWLYSVDLTDAGSNGMVYTTMPRWFRRCLACDRLQYLLWKNEYQEPATQESR